MTQPAPEAASPPAPKRPLWWRLIRGGLRGLLALVLVVAAYFGAAEVLSRIPVNRGADPLAGTIDVYLVTNGVHVDLWLPAQNEARDWAAWLPLDVPVDPDGYVGFGWGDRGFFLEVPTWDNLTLGVALHAVFWPSATAMHVSAYAGAPRSGDDIHLVRLTPERYRDLVAFIDAGFALAAGRPRLINHPGYQQNDRFFEGRGSYHLFRTCNVWTNEAVAAAGLPAGLWTPFERHARRHLPKNRGEAPPR